MAYQPATQPHTVDTSAGPITVDALVPVPGLHVFQLPAEVSTDSPYRWILALHDGPALASFKAEAEASGAAEQAAPLVDWTRNSMTVANLLGPAGMDDLMQLLRAAGGQHPNA
ncbi:hypothetical protein GPZ77_34285 (plasmid) [Streptomyces sp. QHH-9511]|uniref:hypothetical protein n=1 Tax=Streptomyces sp. QHH-9511 TaxID=2684468 RepID=UPI0013169833|nr:hypothetical protein [Streptomyces sp. QHH-9511]QGZ53301.1 hypothetical protein GPZ77_34285 [Streptomyces sp. QHH-9511]